MEYLSTSYATAGVKWVAAGRSEERVRRAITEVEKLSGASLASVPVATASIDDPASLDALLAPAKAVIATAGPYIKYGAAVVAAAVRNGTDYVDLTGEPHFIKAMIEAHHAEAVASGVRVVHACGFDCVPTDIGTLVAVDAVRRLRGGRGTAKVTAALKRGPLSASGGTLATMLLMEREHPELLESDDAYTLLPADAPRGTDALLPHGAGRDDDLGISYGDALMQVVDARVVHRSDYFNRYGSDFHFADVMEMPWAAAKAAAWFHCLAPHVIRSRLFGGLVDRVVTKPGSGPKRDWMKKSHFKMVFKAEPQDADAAKSVSSASTAPADVEGAKPVFASFGYRHGDPGYWATARMLVESGLALALDKAKIEADDRVQRGGVLTPASGIGFALVDRLRDAGFDLEVQEDQ